MPKRSDNQLTPAEQDKVWSVLKSFAFDVESRGKDDALSNVNEWYGIIGKMMLSRERAGARRERRSLLDKARAMFGPFIKRATKDREQAIAVANAAADPTTGPVVHVPVPNDPAVTEMACYIDWIDQDGENPGRAARVRKATGGL